MTKPNAERAPCRRAQLCEQREPPDVFVAALQRVSSGQIYLSERMTNRMLDQVLTDRIETSRSPIETRPIGN